MTQTPARSGPMNPVAQSRHRRPSMLAIALGLGWALAHAQPAPPPPNMAASAPLQNSALDAPMFYQLLVGEMEAQAGRDASAFEVMLDAARRTRDPSLYQRAVDLAVRSRSGDKALAAARAWREAAPTSVDATRTTLQLLVALDRSAEVAEPLRALIQQVGPEGRAGAIAGIPQFLHSAKDQPRTYAAVEQALAPYLNTEATRTAARTTLGRMALAAGQPELALAHARRALADEPAATPPVLLALELMPQAPAAEALVQASLERKDAPAGLRLAYARALEQRQRMVDVIAQLRLAVQQQPDLTQGWLSLGAALLDLHETSPATEALEKASALVQAMEAPATAPEDDDEVPNRQRLQEVIWQLLAQAAEQRGDDKAVLDWLSHIGPARVDTQVLVRRASVLARQDKLDEARSLVREAPAADKPDERTRLLAEAQLLRNVKRWQEAYDLLLTGMRRKPDDTTVIYELAMVAERLKRPDDMEALLRRAVALKPEDPQALNALGYTLADRNERLDEAQTLVRKAVSLAPNDPFIADSLGWVEFRLGHHDEALRVLRQAYGNRPHVEVAAHLGEVLWATGQRDEALRVWRDGAAREPGNDVLQETLTRLKVGL
ncbi:MAG: tetratricopeptide repeat protein [Burkholderiales bacterium]|nr:tetratricopeptide repeat protein [Burkholderiales bacterium]